MFRYYFLLCLINLALGFVPFKSFNSLSLLQRPNVVDLKISSLKFLNLEPSLKKSDLTLEKKALRSIFLFISKIFRVKKSVNKILLRKVPEEFNYLPSSRSKILINRNNQDCLKSDLPQLCIQINDKNRYYNECITRMKSIRCVSQYETQEYYDNLKRFLR
jgi:hypothetical protein